jgi:hypothetical protein
MITRDFLLRSARLDEKKPNKHSKFLHKNRSNVTQKYIRNIHGRMLRVPKEHSYSPQDDKIYSLNDLVGLRKNINSELGKNISISDYLENSTDKNLVFESKTNILENKLNHYTTLLIKTWNDSN